MVSSVKTDKQRLAQTFGKAAKHYDDYALIQRYSGEQLMDLADNDLGNIVLDAGCGTGYFSQKWKLKGKYVIALDLSPQMLQVAQQKQRASSYLLSDIEHCAIGDKSVDIIFSNLAMQWCDNLPAAIKTLMRTLSTSGSLYFSTLSTSSLQEVRDAWQSLDDYSHINPFLSFHEIEKACAGFKTELITENIIEQYDSLSDLFASLKGVGANHLQGERQKGLMTRHKYRELEKMWKKELGKYLLTYQLVIGKISHG